MSRYVQHIKEVDRRNHLRYGAKYEDKKPQYQPPKIDLTGLYFVAGFVAGLLVASALLG